MAALREWLQDKAPTQLPPGAIGWNYHRFGTAETHALLRTWSQDGHILAVAVQDSPKLVGMTVAPDAFHDEDFARRLVQDLSCPGAAFCRKERPPLRPGKACCSTTC